MIILLINELYTLSMMSPLHKYPSSNTDLHYRKQHTKWKAGEMWDNCAMQMYNSLDSKQVRCIDTGTWTNNEMIYNWVNQDKKPMEWNELVQTKFCSKCLFSIKIRYFFIPSSKHFILVHNPIKLRKTEKFC